MNIIIFGAGAIGSLFGALLSKNNDIILYGKKPHIDIIKRKGLRIIGKTTFHKKLQANSNINNIKMKADLIILSVKSYDTNNALKQIKKIADNNTIILSIQNGLDNIEKIKKIINHKQIICGITNQGSYFAKPGLINHTGLGPTFLGELEENYSTRIKQIIQLFNKSGIYTKYTNDILKEIWIKAIINSSINPLTTIFRCKNGYLIKNPILLKLVKLICNESSNIAIGEGFNLNSDNIFQRTLNIIKNTSDNYSSMLQGYIKNKKTEIESINGKFISVGEKRDIDCNINQLLMKIIHSIS
jgi:2-dehydropantoate 2-reductase